MSSNYLVAPCNYKYRVSTLERVVDGDTVDVVLDLGFDILTRQRVRLLGIDTPESRTTDLEEKVFGMLSKQKLKEWCYRKNNDDDDMKIELHCPRSDSRGKFGRALAELWVYRKGEWTNVNRWMCEQGYAVPYGAENKWRLRELHRANREKLIERGEVEPSVPPPRSISDVSS